MFDFEYAGGERFAIMVLAHRHSTLNNDRSRIHFRYDEVHAGAVDLHPCGKRTPMGVEAFECGKQRGMDVDEPPIPAADEPWGKQPHESGKTDEFDVSLDQQLLDHLFEGLSVVAVRGVVNDRRLDSGRARVRQSGRFGAIRKHKRNLGGVVGQAADGVAHAGRGAGELRPGQLHAVPGVAAQPHRRRFQELERRRGGLVTGGAAHPGV